MENSAVYQRRDIDGEHGLRLALHCWGDPQARPLLFLHGFGQTAKAWENSAHSLAQRGYFCAALDARGHGESAWCDQANYAIEYFERDLTLTLQQFNRRPTLVGASMGGLLAIGCEADQQGLFDGMVLVDITPRWEEKGVNRILDFMAAKPNGFADLEEAAATVSTYLPHRAKARGNGSNAFDGLRKNLRLGDDGRYRWHWDPQLLTNIKQAGDRQLPRLHAAAQKLTLPIRLVSGGNSDVTSDHTINEFLQLVPQADHVRIDDAHHMVAGDSNDHFSAAVIDFINSLGNTPDATLYGNSESPDSILEPSHSGDTSCQLSV